MSVIWQAASDDAYFGNDAFEIGESTKTLAPETDSLTELHQTLKEAHALAVQNSVFVVVCASLDGLRCTRLNAWNKGWLMFVDVNKDYIPDAKATHTSALSKKNQSLRSNRTAPGLFRYGPSGITAHIGTFALCDFDLQQARLLVVSSKNIRTVDQVSGIDANRYCPRIGS